MASRSSTSNSNETVFGVNEMRLSARQWIAALAIVVLIANFIPVAAKRFETFSPGADYRIPYALSKDYWLYQRRAELLDDRHRIPVIGDSVVWGEYVRPDGTLSHFLNKEGGENDQFVNCGVNGLFPLALEGLIRGYGGSFRSRKVIVQCNLLWLTSPKADLSIEQEEKFNHSRLVPQFSIRIPCYRASTAERLSAVFERHCEFFAWTSHLQSAYYEQKSLAQWTLKEEEGASQRYPNAWRNPIEPLKGGLPSEPQSDPQRGPDSPRHKRWNAGGGELTHFEWVSLDKSLQWQAFTRLIKLLQSRNNDVFVILGPFNEHMIAEDQRLGYFNLRDSAAAALKKSGAQVMVPDALPSNLYADASHPLTEGYAMLAAKSKSDETFAAWLKSDER